MLIVDKATYIVFSDDDLPPGDPNHTHSLYISVSCLGYSVSSILLDNDFALNVYPLVTAVALSFVPYDFEPCTQIVRAYNSTKREVLGTLMMNLHIGPTTFPIVFQVLRILISFNLLLGLPWIRRARAIISSLHQNVKFIYEG